MDGFRCTATHSHFGKRSTCPRTGALQTSIFTSNLEARCALDGGAQHPGFDDHARFIAQDDLDVAVHLFSLGPRNAQPENDTLLKVARDPVERIVFTFGVQADRFAGGGHAWSSNR